MNKTLPKPIADTLEYITSGAIEITGCHAPYAMDPEREYIKNVHEAISEALAYLPAPVLSALAIRLEAADIICADTIIKGEEAYNAAHQVAQ